VLGRECLAVSSGSATIGPDTRSDAKVTGLISAAHFFSHLYLLALPPIFPVLQAELGIGATQLGLVIAALNVTTMLAQTPTGMLVDRIGPAWILIVGHSLFAIGIALMGIFPSFGAILVFAVLAGLGNAVYHPADYTVLSTRISPTRIGRAYAIHTFGGYLGFAAAPLSVVPLTELFGWRAALVVLGIAGLLVSLLLVIYRRELGEAKTAAPKGAAKARSRDDMRLFLSGPVLLSLLFFLLLSGGHVGMATFSPAALSAIYDLSLVAANLPVTVYLLVSSGGVLLGGWLVDRSGRHAMLVGGSALVIAASALVVALVRLEPVGLVAVFLIAGLASGVLAPARDMLVRAITPPGASGRVFGFVTTGFNIGSLLAPPIYGLMIDHGAPRGVFWAVAVVSALTLVTVMGASGRRVPQA
jgi:MFS transporter, FSR family, fosmidomycin resistance protein